MDSSEYKHAKDTSDDEKSMEKSLRDKDYGKAIEEAEKVLASEYVNLDAHYVEFVSYRELGQVDKAQYHRAVFKGLIDSILHSGDGKSPETAWVVISVPEEYVVLGVMGYKPSEQSLIGKNGHMYDMMKVKRVDDGSDATFYFNTDIPMKHGGL